MRLRLALGFVAALGSVTALGQIPYVAPGQTLASALVNEIIAEINGATHTVANNNALIAITPGQYQVIYREGYSSPGDGGAATYFSSTSACSQFSGAGDGGGQIKPASGSGCWILDPTAQVLTPMIWGAAGNGIANDSGPVQAALNYATGGTLVLGSHLYGTTQTLNVNAVKIVAAQNGRVFSGTVQKNSGFVGLTANMNVLNVQGDVTLDGVFVTVNGAPTSGSAILTTATSHDDRFTNVYVDGVCYGVTINGNVITLDHSMVSDFLGSSCYGVVVGNLTTSGATVDPTISDTKIISNQGNPGGAGMIVYDAGGLTLMNNDNLYSVHGTVFDPGANQEITWTFIDNTVLGDTTTSSPLVIDTSSSSALVEGVDISNSWTSNNTSGANVVIQSTAGGTVRGVHFAGHRALQGQSSSDVIDVGLVGGSSIQQVSVNDSRVCGGQGVGVNWGPGVTDVKLTASQVGSICEGQTAGAMIYAVNFNGNTGAVITDNNLCGPASPFNGNPSGFSAVDHNLCDAASSTVASAASIALPNPLPTIDLTGDATVTNITNYWSNRSVAFVTTGGAITFAAGGSGPGAMCNSITSSGANGVVLALYVAQLGCWALK